MGRCAQMAWLVAAVWLAAGSARAQNDWQFPDPYFGAVELQKDHPPRPRTPRIEAPVRPAAPSAGRQRPRLFRPRAWSASRPRP